MNSLVTLHRQRYPNDTRSDDAITLDYAAQDPATFNQIPDAVKDLDRIKAELAQAAQTQPGALGYVKQAAGEIIRAPFEVVADLPKASAKLAAGLPLPMVQFGGPDGIRAGLSNERDAGGNLVFDPSDSVSAQLGEKISALGRRLSPEPVEALKDSFWATKIPSTAGSLAAFIAAGGFGRALAEGSVKAVISAVEKDAALELMERGIERSIAENAAKTFADTAVRKNLATEIAQALPVGLEGAAAQANSAYDEALAKTKDPDVAWKAAVANLPVGAAFALPAHRLMPGSVSKAALPGRIAADTALGTGVMAGQQLASNAIAKGVYDPDRDLAAGLGQTAGAGAIVTAALSGLSHGLLARRESAEQSRGATRADEPHTNEPEVINPADQYKADPETVAQIRTVIEREQAGERGPEIETALSAVYADPNLHALYTLEKQRLQTESQQAAAEPSADSRSTADDPALSTVPGESTSEADANVRLSDRGGAEPAPAWTMPQEDFVSSVTRKAGSQTDAARRFHQKQVEVAVAQGRPVPPEVLADYPGITERVQADLQKSQADVQKANALTRARQRMTEAGYVDPAEKAMSEARVKVVGDAGRFWELTPEEYSAYSARVIKERGLKPATPTTLKEAHLGWVKKALDQGKAVPDRVLAEYPELAKPATPAKTAARQPDSEGAEPAIEASPDPTKVPGIWRQLETTPASILPKVDFAGAQVTSQAAGRGKKAAPAWIETSDPNELYKDHTASSSDKMLSRKQGVFLAPDGTHVLIGTAYENRGIRYVTGFDQAGAPKAFRFEKLTGEMGYRLVGSLKTKEPTKGHVSTLRTYSPEGYEKLVSALRSNRDAARSTAAAVEQHLEQSKDSGRSGATKNQREISQVETETPGPVEFGPEHGEVLFTALQNLKPSELETGFVAAIKQSGKRAVAAVEAALETIIRDSGLDPKHALETLKIILYETHNEASNRQSAAEYARALETRLSPERVEPTGERGAEPEGPGSRKAETLPVERPGSTNAGRGSASPGPGGSREGTEARTDANAKRAEIAQASAEVDTNPTEAQKQAGNYRKGHVSIDGLDVTIENPRGSVRSGTGSDGQRWSVEMPADYGYIKGTRGADGKDHVDVYLGEHPESKRVWVIDQIDPLSGEFDEHKVMVGFTSRADAVRAYVAAFSDGSGRARIGAITEMPRGEFTDWVRKGNTRKALAYSERTVDKPELVRFSLANEDGSTGSRHLASPAYLQAAWDSAIETAAANGLNVSVLQGLHERGVYSPRAIALTIADPLRPSHDNVVLLFHEVGHDVFAQLKLPVAVEDAFHRAIEKLSVPEAFNPKVADAVSNKAAVRAEEVLVERAARNLVSEGFNPADAAGIAQRIVRAVKELYLRAAMAIQRSLFGNDHVNPELAQRWFESRLRSFLAGDTAPMSFLSFLGGPKLTTQQRGETFAPMGGVGGLSGHFDPERGMQFREVLPETWAAMRQNAEAVRLSSPRQTRLTAAPKVDRTFGDVNPNLARDGSQLKAPVPSWFPQTEREKFALEYFGTLPERFTNRHGHSFWLKKPEPGFDGQEALRQRALHWVRPDATQGEAIHKGETLRSVLRTLEDPSFVLRQADRDLLLYARVYDDPARPGNGLIHFVVVDPKDNSVVTQFPFSDASGTRHNADVVTWVRPQEKAAAANQPSGEASAQQSKAVGPAATLTGTTVTPERPSGQVRFSERAGTAFVQTGDPHVISRDLNSPEKVKEDIGAYNALHDAHEAAYRAFMAAHLEKSGYTLEAFVRDFTNAEGLATEKIGARNEELKANGFAAVDPTLRPHDLLSEASQMQSADKGYRYLWSLREHWTQRRKSSEQFLKTADERMKTLSARLQEMKSDYTDLDMHLSQARVELAGLHQDFRGDLDGAVNSARKVGILTQVIAQLEQRSADPLSLARQYRAPINRLFDQIAGNLDAGRRFTDILAAVAKLDIDWSGQDARAIRDTIALVAHTDPLLRRLLEPQEESRALLSIVTAFGKSNAHIMEFLKLGRSEALEDRAKLNTILKDVVNGTKEGLAKARELARKLPKLAVSADRLLTKLEELQDQSRQHIDEMQRARAFIDLNTAALPGLRAQMVTLEKMIGARLQSWEPVNGAEYFLAPAVNATPEAVLANKRAVRLTAGESIAEDVLTHIKANNAWLDAVAPEMRGAVWNTVKEMTTKLETQVALVRHEFVIKRSVINTLLGSLPDKLEATGIPALRSAASRFRRAQAERHAATTDADNSGLKWMRAEAAAMKALGLEGAGQERFQRLFLQSALSFAEKNPDIRAQFKSDREGFTALLPRLRSYLENDADTRAFLQRPKAWDALRNYYNATFESQQFVNGLRKKLGIKIQEIGPDGFKIEREPLGATFFTATRRVSREAVRLYHDMRELGWLGTDEGKLDADSVSKLYATDPEALAARLSKLFTPEVWRDFVKPLAEMEGRAAVYGPKGIDGITRIALREHVLKAFEASNGDPLRFAEALFTLETTVMPHTAETRSEFVGKTMQAFQEFFDSIHATQAEYDHGLRAGLPTPPRLLQDARISEAWPGQWLEYQTYDRWSMHQMVNLLAQQAAFGRNMESMRRDFQAGIKELTQKASKFAKITDLVIEANPGVNKGRLRDLVRRESEKQGENYTSLSEAGRNLQTVKGERDQFEALLRSQNGLAMELRWFQELVGALAGATVQGPGTALMQFADFGQAFAKMGLGSVALNTLKTSAKSFAGEAFGSLAQAFHLNIALNAERNARRARNGIVDPDAKRHFADVAAAVLHDTTGDMANPVTRAVTRGARLLRALTSSGFGEAQGEQAYVTLKPHALFSQLTLQQQFSLIDGYVGAFENMVERAVNYFKDPSHAAELSDAKFEFKSHKDLGYWSGLFGIGSDERAFAFLNNALNRYGMRLETLARDTLKRRETNPSASPLNDAQFRSLASLVQTEVTLDSSPATRPSRMFTNPVLHLANPLLGWSLSKSEDVWKAWRNPNMTQTSPVFFKAFLTGLRPYLALVPISVALAYLRDDYDEKLLAKKANRSEPDSFKGMTDALARVGTFGVFGDVSNSLVNRDTERPFSVDNRVYALSSMFSAARSLSTWMRQGSADYSTVYRPMLASLGGSGYLQYAQLLNRATSMFGDGPLFEAESRVTARINANNYLRVAGRELGMDVRVNLGGEVIGTPVRPFIGQMVLAAYANDAAGFREAYRNAIAASREENKPDPQDYVKRAFAAMHPLRTVFRTEPSQPEYARLLASLNDSGRAAVSSALHLFNAYATQLGIKADYGKNTARSSPLSLDQIRSRLAGEPPSNVLSLDEIRSRMANY